MIGFSSNRHTIGSSPFNAKNYISAIAMVSERFTSHLFEKHQLSV